MALENRRFAVRYSLKLKKVDSRVQLSQNDSLPVVHKPITYRMIGQLMVAFLLGMFLVTSTPINPMRGSWIGFILFICGYVYLLRLLFTRDESLTYGYSYLFKLIFYYLSPYARGFTTMSTDDCKYVYQVFGVKSIDKQGLIHFTDDTCGYLLDIEGYASIMLMRSDELLILDSARTVYYQLQPTININVYTRSRPQDVKTQFDSKVTQLQNLKRDNVRSVGLRNIVKNQAKVLKDVVGKQFSVTSQYILIRGTRTDLENTVQNILSLIGPGDLAFLKRGRILTNEAPLRDKTNRLVNRPYELEHALKLIWDLP